MVSEILIFIAAFMLLLILSWLNIMANKAIKKTRSIKKFSGTYPKIYRNILICVLWFCVLVGTIFYASIRFFYYMDTGADMGHVVFSIALSAMFLFFWIVLILDRIDVDDDKLKYRNMIGIKKSTSADKINRIIKTEESLDIYADGKYFGAFSKYMLLQSNFYKWCEQKGIPVETEPKHSITKQTLYYRAIKEAFKGGVTIGIFLPVLILPIYFFTDAFDEGGANFIELVLFFGGMVLLVALLFAIPFCTTAFTAVCRIKHQEACLGFCFNEEMQNNNVKEFVYKSNNWFIDIEQPGYLAVWRRDYIATIEKRSTTGHTTSLLIIIAVDGKKIKIKHGHANILALETWFKNLV